MLWYIIRLRDCGPRIHNYLDYTDFQIPRRGSKIPNHLNYNQNNIDTQFLKRGLRIRNHPSYNMK